MGRLRRPDLPPGPLAELVHELHNLHARAGWPSTRLLARGQGFSHTAVHELFTRTLREPPRLPVLHRVVEQLAHLAPRTDVDATLERFDALWRAADESASGRPPRAVAEEARPADDDVTMDIDLVLHRSGPRALAAELAGALFGGRLTMLYQPIVGWDGTVLSAEALLRWHHPTRGLIAPRDFLPTAHDAGLMRDVELWALEAALSEARSWTTVSGGGPSVAVDVGELLPGDLPAIRSVIDAVDRSRTAWDRVVFELDQARLSASPSEDLAPLSGLVERGARFTLDDFRLDTALLSRLVDIPVHAVNINRGLVSRMAHHPAESAIVRAIVDICHASGRRVIAEGVESAAQLLALRDMGVDAYQGYLIQRPVEPEALRALLWAGGLPDLGTHLSAGESQP